GICERLRDLCLAYAHPKQVRGQSLLAHGGFAGKLGQIEMEIEAIRAVCRAAATDFDEARQNGGAKVRRAGVLKSAIVSKLLSGQLAWKVASVASEAFGGIGYTDESLVGKLLRDVRVISVIEAGDEVLRDLLFNRYVAKRVDAIAGAPQE